MHAGFVSNYIHHVPWALNRWAVMFKFKLFRRKLVVNKRKLSGLKTVHYNIQEFCYRTDGGFLWGWFPRDCCLQPAVYSIGRFCPDSGIDRLATEASHKKTTVMGEDA